MTENESISSDEESSGSATSPKEETNEIMIAKIISDHKEDISGDIHIETEEDPNMTRARTIGAGVAVGLVTMPFGIVLAVLAGVGAAFGTKKEGPTGEVCRAAGDVALAARDKAVELNEEHHLIEKAKEGVKEGVENMKEKDKKFGLTDKIGAGLLAVASTLKKIAEKLRGGSKSTGGDDTVSPDDHNVSGGMNE